MDHQQRAIARVAFPMLHDKKEAAGLAWLAGPGAPYSSTFVNALATGRR